MIPWRRSSATALLPLALLAMVPCAARAEGLNLAWNTCLAGAAAVSDMAFACDDDDRAFTAVGSFIPPGGISHLAAAEMAINVMTDQRDVPDWWRFDAAGCRPNSFVAQFDFRGITGCKNPWGSQTASGYLFEAVDAGPARWRFRALVAKSIEQAGPVSPGIEYDAFMLVIDTQRTKGGACAGCAQGVCLVFASLALDSPPGEGDHLLTTPATRNCVTWQGGSPSCPSECRQQTRRTTWGQVKNLYR